MMLRRITYVLVLIATVCGVAAQTKGELKRSKKLKKNADISFKAGDYAIAWTDYRDVLRVRPAESEAAINAAVSAIRLNYPVDSLARLEPSLASSSSPAARFYLAKLYHRQHKFTEAITIIEELTKTAEKKRGVPDADLKRLSANCSSARNYINRPHLASIKNLGPAVNSKYDDYVPVPVPDESSLYFTSKRAGSTGSTLNGDNKFFEDIYVSRRDKGAWRQAENAGFPLNTATNDACVAISPDGHSMIIYRTSDDGTTGDLYLSRLGRNEHWSKPEKMPAVINSEFVETSACFSNDSSEIFFSSDRPGGLGGKDLYRIKKLPDGQWSAPMNLGGNVNTPLDEDSPFLHYDGVTLFFSSKGHDSMGEYDVFKSVWNGQTNSFEEATNLGYPVNDVDNDIFFTMTADGRRGYYSSVKEVTQGGEDIYEIDTRFGDNDTYVKSGYAYLGTTPARVRIAVAEKSTGEETGVYFSHPETGKFIILLNPMKAYTITAEEEGYKTETFDIPPVVEERRDQTLRIILSRERNIR